MSSVHRRRRIFIFIDLVAQFIFVADCASKRINCSLLRSTWIASMAHDLNPWFYINNDNRSSWSQKPNWRRPWGSNFSLCNKSYHNYHNCYHCLHHRKHVPHPHKYLMCHPFFSFFRNLTRTQRSFLGVADSFVITVNLRAIVGISENEGGTILNTKWYSRFT